MELTSIFTILLVYLAILAVSISFHEAAHAWMANKLGDPTARYQGRISLNPLVHIDPIGTVILPLFLIFVGITTGKFFLFGWAKPTPFNPWNLANPKRDSALISLAGPLSNFLISIFLAIILRFTDLKILATIIELNLTLAVFNLIPIHPLDGFKVVGGLLPKSTYLQWMELEKFGPIFLLFFFIYGRGVLSTLVEPLKALLGL